MFWAVIATQLSAPTPIDYLSWWSPDDMPAYHQRAGVTRSVSYRVHVSVDGKIQRCEMERSSGDPKLDSLTCAIIAKRGRFKPASGADGRPVQGLYRGTATWAVGNPPKYPPSHVAIALEKFPKKVRPPASVNVIFSVDESGRILDCIGEKPEDNVELVAMACAAANAANIALPVTGVGGDRVRSVQNASVMFRKR